MGSASQWVPLSGHDALVVRPELFDDSTDICQDLAIGLPWDIAGKATLSEKLKGNLQCLHFGISLLFHRSLRLLNLSKQGCHRWDLDHWPEMLGQLVDGLRVRLRYGNDIQRVPGPSLDTAVFSRGGPSDSALVLQVSLTLPTATATYPAYSTFQHSSSTRSSSSWQRQVSVYPW